MTSQVMTTQAIRDAKPENVEASLGTWRGFQAMEKMAIMLSNSTIIPVEFRSHIPNKSMPKINGEHPLMENPSGVANCLVALNMANRLNADPLMVMQNLYIIDGRPSWSSQFVISAINSCGRYSPLRFDIQDLGQTEVTITTKKWSKDPKGRNTAEDVTSKISISNKVCVAWAIEKATGERLESAPIDLELAVKEGWYGKSGSKWQTMPDQMLRYRAAAFFGRIYAPELLMGLQAADEVVDVVEVIDVTPPASTTTQSLRDQVSVVEAEVVEPEPKPRPKKGKEIIDPIEAPAPQPPAEPDQTASQEAEVIKSILTMVQTAPSPQAARAYRNYANYKGLTPQGKQLVDEAIDARIAQVEAISIPVEMPKPSLLVQLQQAKDLDVLGQLSSGIEMADPAIRPQLWKAYEQREDELEG